MPRRTTSTPALSGSAAYTHLEKRLVLLAWLHSLFGYRDTTELLGATAPAEEGFDANGRSYVYHALLSRGPRVLIPPETLASYDDNVRMHLAAINAQRPEPIVLRYFQHLAALYTEVFLDWSANRPGELIRQLNSFVRRRNASRMPGEPEESLVQSKDLTKLAFWMATGSGKTLIMHLNYRQFLHYHRGPLDNILLIAPNEGLSRQHMQEMELSGIPCRRFDPETSGLALGAENAVQVLEITKLVQEKRGSGVSVPVEAFEGNNLIFVDEGHKGSGGEAWRRFRDVLGQTGFTFEYSATFGQALTAARDDALTAEYGKAIVFDYSYRYFYGDGYGKDFHIINLREAAADDKTDLLLLGNLLSFYEQLRMFEEQSKPLRPYNLERPLWVFVGSSVNAVFKESGQPRSDVLAVVRFIQRFLQNRRGWATRGIASFLDGRSGLVDAAGADLFAERFAYLRGRRGDAAASYDDIVARVFQARGGGTLHLANIRSSTGEIGLKVGGADEYFGVIYIGDATAFKRLVEADARGVVVEDDAIAGSLFERINEPSTRLNVLVGAKKFMEGWNSWRVSSMGLLNIGRSEGSEIIQLFGRGVRLKGRGLSLKRSSRLDGAHPRDLRLLETLDIFALRANYMTQFRDYLEREGVETVGFAELALPIRTNTTFLRKGLVVPRVAQGRDFVRDCSVLLAVDTAAVVQVDASVRVESLRSSAEGIVSQSVRSGEAREIPAASLDLVAWDRLYLSLLEYKEQRRFDNLAIQPRVLRKIMEHAEPRLYRLNADEDTINPTTFAGKARLEAAVLAVLRKYVDRFYYVQRERWESTNMTWVVMDRRDPNLRDYAIRIPRSELALLRSIRALLERGTALYRQEVRDLPNVHFDRHLYQPLLVHRDGPIKTDPPGLNEHEERFVKDLRQYAQERKANALQGREVFLLRNLTKGKGVGFFESEGFYPDFILWIKHGKLQRVVFVEPHGLRHEKAYWSDDRARLHERLREYSAKWTSGLALRDVTLDAFVVSATSYDEVRPYYGDHGWTRAEFADHHILFFDAGHGYIERLLGDMKTPTPA